MLASLFRRITNPLLIHSHAIKSAIQIGDTNALHALFNKEITTPLLKDENFVIEAIRAKKLPLEKKQLLLTNLVQRGFSAEGILFDRLVDLNFLTSVVKAGADISCTKQSGENPLHTAAISNNKCHQRIDLVLSEKNINSINNDEFGNTPLHVLIINELEEAALHLLKQALSRGISVDFNIKDKEGKTPLIMATKVLQSNLIKLLLELRQQGQAIDIDATDYSGRTALHYACLLGQDHIVDALIKSGADYMKRDKQGLLPIEYILYLNYNDIIRCLLSVSINPDRDEKARYNKIHSPLFKDIPLFMIDGALIPADLPAKKTSIPVLLDMIKHASFDDAVIDHFFEDRLKDAEDDYTKSHALRMVQAVITRHNHLDALYQQINEFTGRNLVEHCSAGDKKVMQILKNLPRIKLTNPENELRIAASYGDNRKISFLVSAFNKININSSSSEDGKTALHNAIQNAHLNSAELLLKCGADIAISDRHGNTPMKLLQQLKQNSPNKFIEHASLNSVLESYEITNKNRP